MALHFILQGLAEPQSLSATAGRLSARHSGSRRDGTSERTMCPRAPTVLGLCTLSFRGFLALGPIRVVSGFSLLV